MQRRSPGVDTLPARPAACPIPGRLLLAVGVLVLAVVGGACGPTERAAVPFHVPRAGDYPAFLEAPWPSDLYLRTDAEGGGLDLRMFPNPFGSGALEEYLGLFQRSPGYARSAGVYIAVPGGLDVSTLPADPAASVAAGSGLFLVDADDPGRRIPVEWKVEEQGNSFLPAGTLQVFPLLGAVPPDRVALVMTSALHTADGKPLGPDEDLAALLACEDLEELARPVDCAAYQELPTAAGVAPDDVALIDFITFQDATLPVAAAAEVVRELGAPTYTVDLLRPEESAWFEIYEGTVELAQFQAGAAPYNSFDGVEGGFVYDDEGRPTVQRYESVRFVLTVPLGEPPQGGYPVAVMGHGTGGDLYSGVGDDPRWEAHQLARAGWAMLTTSEPLHETREGFSAGSEELLTFNFLNPVAGRSVWLQSALEKMQLVSLVPELAVHWSLGGRSLTFDPEHVGYFGHSQGGIVGAVFVGVEDRIQGAFLSGAGAGFAPSLIEKTEPIVIADAVRTLLGFPADEPLDRFHPLLTLLQIWVDPADPVNYGRAWRHRGASRVPHLAMTSGLRDLYTPKRNHGGMAGAFGLPLVQPVAEAVPVLELNGVPAVGREARGNLRDDEGRAITGGLLQYPDDGHFAVFNNPDAQDAYRRFFESLLESGGVPAARATR